jgi:hypothetical protein
VVSGRGEDWRGEACKADPVDDPEPTVDALARALVGAGTSFVEMPGKLGVMVKP